MDFLYLLYIWYRKDHEINESVTQLVKIFYHYFLLWDILYYFFSLSNFTKPILAKKLSFIIFLSLISNVFDQKYSILLTLILMASIFIECFEKAHAFVQCYFVTVLYM